MAKLVDSEAEAAETQTWLKFSRECDYLSRKDFEELSKGYHYILGKLVTMERHPEDWSI
ncbi:MAG: four helix bundle protein [Candidatus Cloacimonetes bacterium]|nr:four helix bundle protein [Candidatus Cloacimonadota bacterium]